MLYFFQDPMGWPSSLCEAIESKKDANMASLAGESQPAQERFTNRKRPLTGKSTPPSSFTPVSLDDLEVKGQADIQCYGCDLPFPTEESLFLPNRSTSSSLVTTSISKSRMPSISSQAGSSQQRCPETLCSSQANSRCRSEYLCEECGKLFKHPASLTNHRKIDRANSKCSSCGNIHST